MRFIEQFDFILLDMGNTFMFDADRFSEHEDFGKTYRQLGGTQLRDTQVKAIILEVFELMQQDYENSKYYECFPAVSNYLLIVTQKFNLPASEIELLYQVFAIQEIGKIPDAHAEAIRQLSKTHKLAVVSNIWCKSELCLKEFKKVEITDCFEKIIFSSDYGIIKPSPLIYQKAIENLGIPPAKIVFVGDDLMRDIAGAKAANFSAVWIDSGITKINENMPKPNLVISDLLELVSR